MSGHRFRHGQTELAARCAPRAVYASEYHIQNQLYGYHELLGAYAGLPAGIPLPWAMEHAITFGTPEPYPAERDTHLPIVLSVTEAQAEPIRTAGHTCVEPIGSAFFYLLAQVRDAEGEGAERRGTLVFPDKSTTHQRTDYDRAGFAARLAALPEAYQPVYVSVFWGDYLRGLHEPFAAAGLPLITSGHPYDPLFLLRQLDSCRAFRYACANDLSTSFCLSILAGCRFFHLPTGPLRVTRDGDSQTFAQDPTFALPGKQRCIAASPFPPRDDAEQQELAHEFAGARFVRPPSFFRELARRGEALLQAEPPAPLRFSDRCRSDDRAPWLFHGVDLDGWAQARWGLVLDPRWGYGSVVLALRVPAREGGGRSTLCVERDGERHAFTVRPGQYRLVVPVRARERVHVECAEEVDLPGEPRRRALWIGAVWGRPPSWIDRLSRRAPRLERGRTGDV